MDATGGRSDRRTGVTGEGPDRRGVAERPALPRPAPSWSEVAAAEEQSFTFRIGSQRWDFRYRQWMDAQGAVFYNGAPAFKCRRGDEDGTVPNIYYLFKSSPNGSWVAAAGPIYYSRHANLTADTHNRFRLVPRDAVPYEAGWHEWQKWDEEGHAWEEEAGNFLTTITTPGALVPASQ